MYTLKDIARAYGYSVRTVNNRLKDLRESNRFQKNSLGKFYDKNEALQLSQILGFDFSALERNRAQNTAK